MEECYFEDQGGDQEMVYEGGMSMELVDTVFSGWLWYEI
jgi:hypothetical protein